jgi:uncharacterized membrane protein YgdD (TMEM256/DUF423 family)
MPSRPRLLLGLAALVGFLSVAAGAFGAPGVTGAAKDWLRTAGEYGLIHALAVLVAASLIGEGARAATVAAWLFLAGAVIFSGSLVAMAVSGQLWLGAVTPVGGLLLLAGWATLALAAFTRRPV